MWRVLRYQVHSAFDNMAIDEAIFREVQENRSPPTIRFYGWLQPSVSLGYFQDIRSEVNLDACKRLGVDVVRRPTGGKAVLHGNDLTYAVIARQEGQRFESGILATYLAISRCLSKALRNWGIPVDCAEPGRSSPEVFLNTSCFAKPSRYELLVNGRKICGSAQARSRGSFLQHGSILIDFDAARTVEVLRGTGDMDEQVRSLANSVTCIRDFRPVVEETPLMMSRYLEDAFASEWEISLDTFGMTERERDLAEQIARGRLLNGTLPGTPEGEEG
ncbi:MAG: lipoate--protein ligase family protein [Syntrophaceae bacterium]|nr:lipoate--protein ligase family protein [Syntrophaceae bacterium]